jgi:hypothetical protein
MPLRFASGQTNFFMDDTRSLQFSKAYCLALTPWPLIGDQNPGEAARFFFLNDSFKPAQEVLSVPIGFKDPPSFDPPHHDMLQDSWSI